MTFWTTNDWDRERERNIAADHDRVRELRAADLRVVPTNVVQIQRGHEIRAARRRQGLRVPPASGPMGGAA